MTTAVGYKCILIEHSFWFLLTMDVDATRQGLHLQKKNFPEKIHKLRTDGEGKAKETSKHRFASKWPLKQCLCVCALLTDCVYTVMSIEYQLLCLNVVRLSESDSGFSFVKFTYFAFYFLLIYCDVYIQLLVQKIAFPKWVILFWLGH